MFLPYGRSLLPLPDLWDGQAVWLVPGPFPDAVGSRRVENALDEPTGSRSIDDTDLSGRNIACVVPDLTRRAAVDLYLPALLSRLLSSGASIEDVTVIIALGIHRALEEREIKKLVGDKIHVRFRVVNHDPDDRNECVVLGVTSGGIPVEINRTVATADLIFLTGSVTYHYFAGYGGGRKTLLPGVASRRTCEAHHRMVVSWKRGDLTGKVGPGILEGNPVHEQMLEACSMVPPIFNLNVVTDPDGGIVGASYGDLQASHLESCRMHDRYYRREVSTPSKLVIASAGGYPKDVNFVQAHKGLYAAHEPVETGAVVILLAQCREGAGYRDFFDWFNRCTSEEAWLTELEGNYHINAQTAFSTWQKVQRTPTILISELDPSLVKTAGMIPASSVEEAIAEARTILGELPLPLVIPDAGDTLTVIKSPTSRASLDKVAFQQAQGPERNRGRTLSKVEG